MTDVKLEQLVARYGIQNASAAVDAAQQGYRPTLARCLALLENESAGRNIFGAEGTACPHEWWEGDVTQERYEIYRRRLNEGATPDGVGPCQLTNPSLQHSADMKGGCWIPIHNMEVGFAFLHGLIIQSGVWGGFRRYNGSGPAAEAYADRALERAGAWQERLSHA